MAQRRPTLEDVAARANVGRGTVSRVVNGSAKVSAGTREAVLRAIAELGYVPYGPARDLVSGSAATVALVLSEEPGRRFEQPYLGLIMSGISAAAAGVSAALTLTFTQAPHDRRALAKTLRDQRVDGVLLISLLDGDPLAGLLERAGIPAVLGGRPIAPDEAPSPHVDADNRGGGRRATEYLVGQGRRRIATIAGPPRSSAAIDRLTGYRDAMDGRRARVVQGDFSEPGGMRAMRRLLDDDPTVDAVFAASDNMAYGALRELERRGLRAPDDIAVVGFEDAPPGRRLRPDLTTVHQPTELMGRRMLESLLARIGGTAVAQPGIVCATDLVIRRSA